MKLISGGRGKPVRFRCASEQKVGKKSEQRTNSGARRNYKIPEGQEDDEKWDGEFQRLRGATSEVSARNGGNCKRFQRESNS